MESNLKRVFIKKLWDYKDIDCNLFEDINIIIGNNGTSKTTFLTLIEAILNIDLEAIESIVFEMVLIEVETSGVKHDISVERIMQDAVTPLFRYRIDGDEIVDISMMDLPPYSRMRISSSNAISFLYNKISQIVSISWLSITRNKATSIDRRRSETDVDLKLKEQMRAVVSYKLQLETQINERTKKFNEDIVSLLLYNEKYDSLPNHDEIDRLMKTSSDELRTQLHQVFSYFGDARQHSTDIEKHVDSIQKLKDIFINRKDLTAQELLPLALLKRTFEMVSLTSQYQSSRASINEPIKSYTDIVGMFIKDKCIEFNKKGEPEIYLKTTNKKEKRQLTLSSLSSGEKQILILLTETLLQQNRPYVFIADEPELSLHIEWQRNLIYSIRSLNPNAQIIFATHAPEIAGNYSKRLINMENVTIYE